MLLVLSYLKIVLHRCLSRAALMASYDSDAAAELVWQGNFSSWLIPIHWWVFVIRCHSRYPLTNVIVEQSYSLQDTKWAGTSSSTMWLHSVVQIWTSHFNASWRSNLVRLLLHCSGNSPLHPQSLCSCQLSQSQLVHTNGVSPPSPSVSTMLFVAQTHVDVKQSLAAVDATKVQIIQPMFVLCMPHVHSGRNWECLTHVLPAKIFLISETTQFQCVQVWSWVPHWLQN